jgi:UDP-2-acetamido-3-amino-2,3-dideoxy-glucuronate N-acetyltransferase
VCGITIGQYAFVGAGALVNRDVPDYALVYGVPSNIKGWICFCGTRLNLSIDLESVDESTCDNCGRDYKKVADKVYELS